MAVAGCRKYSEVLCLWILPCCEHEMAVLALWECETVPIVLGNNMNPSSGWAHRHSSKLQSQIWQRRSIFVQKEERKEILHNKCRTVQIDDESLMTIRAVSKFLPINPFFSLSEEASCFAQGWPFLDCMGSCFSVSQLSGSCFASLTVLSGSFFLSKFEVLSSKTKILSRTP